MVLFQRLCSHCHSRSVVYHRAQAVPPVQRLDRLVNRAGANHRFCRALVATRAALTHAQADVIGAYDGAQLGGKIGVGWGRVALR